MELKIEVTGGSFAYEKRGTLFKDISFKLDKGQILTVLGLNGVGKTTLLKCIIGIYKWSSGSTYIDDISLKKYRQIDIWKKISCVSQVQKLVFAYTVLDMVVMGRAPYLSVFSSPSEKDREKVLEVLSELSIDHLADKSCGEISSGELQLVMIARALVSEPQIMVLDEPESHLDLSNQMLILRVLKNLSQKKKITCIINTHYPQHALSISDKTLLLGRNQNHIYGSTSDIIKEENLKEYFDLDVKIINYKDEHMFGEMIYPCELAQKI